MSGRALGQHSRFRLSYIVVFLAGMVLACSHNNSDTTSRFEVNVEDQAGSKVCEIVFYGSLPAPERVDQIVRDSLEKAVQADPSRDILASAFLGDETLNSNQYSGMLVYKASAKKIMTLNEYDGVKTSTTSTASYFVEIEDLKTYPGITPAKKWLSLTIVFPKTPSREVAYSAIVTEIEKVKTRELDIDAYVSVGDKNVKTSWYQMRDNDGAFVFANYDSATKTITRKGELLKELR